MFFSYKGVYMKKLSISCLTAAVLLAGGLCLADNSTTATAVMTKKEPVISNEINIPAVNEVLTLKVDELSARQKLNYQALMLELEGFKNIFEIKKIDYQNGVLPLDQLNVAALDFYYAGFNGLKLLKLDAANNEVLTTFKNGIEQCLTNNFELLRDQKSVKNGSEIDVFAAEIELLTFKISEILPSEQCLPAAERLESVLKQYLAAVKTAYNTGNESAITVSQAQIALAEFYANPLLSDSLPLETLTSGVAALK